MAWEFDLLRWRSYCEKRHKFVQYEANRSAQRIETKISHPDSSGTYYKDITMTNSYFGTVLKSALLSFSICLIKQLSSFTSSLAGCGSCYFTFHCLKSFLEDLVPPGIGNLNHVYFWYRTRSLQWTQHFPKCKSALYARVWRTFMTKYKPRLCAHRTSTQSNELK